MPTSAEKKGTERTRAGARGLAGVRNQLSVRRSRRWEVLVSVACEDRVAREASADVQATSRRAKIWSLVGAWDNEDTGLLGNQPWKGKGVSATEATACTRMFLVLVRATWSSMTSLLLVHSLSTVASIFTCCTSRSSCTFPSASCKDLATSFHC